MPEPQPEGEFMRVCMLSVVVFFVAGLAGAQDDLERFKLSKERFELFNNCRAMGVVVGFSDDDDAPLGLTEDRISTMAESRLRAARLYDVDAGTWLSVNVNIVSLSYSRSMGYFKPVRDVPSGEAGFAVTWRDRGGTGTHGGSADFILGALSEYIDTFIRKYRRVNETAC